MFIRGSVGVVRLVMLVGSVAVVGGCALLPQPVLPGESAGVLIVKPGTAYSPLVTLPLAPAGSETPPERD